jgi:hypothetical protein
MHSRIHTFKHFKINERKLEPTMKILKCASFGLIIVCLLFSCKPKETSKPVGTAEKLPAICIVGGVSVKENPTLDSKWFYTLKAGESITYLGIEQSDNTTNPQKFLKVQLNDGRQGWVKSYSLLLNAAGAAIIKETGIYSQANPAYSTKQYFYPLEFVAILNEKGNWLEVVGNEKIKKGWIPSTTITRNAPDIAVASLDKNGLVVKEKISGFLTQPGVQESAFVEYLNSKLEKHVEDAIEQSIEDYENK